MERQARNIDVDTAEVVYELPLLLLPGVVFTLIFLRLDSVCCCCRCLLLPAVLYCTVLLQVPAAARWPGLGV